MSINIALVALTLSVHSPHPGHTDMEMVTVRGRAVCPAATQAASEATPAVQECIFETTNGKKYSLVHVITSRALFEDANLRAKDLEVTGQLDAAGRLEVIQTRSVKNGKLHDVYYWCETCHIRSPYGGDCWCCFQPFEFKEVPMRD
jgi:hypothetical protein